MKKLFGIIKVVRPQHDMLIESDEKRFEEHIKKQLAYNLAEELLKQDLLEFEQTTTCDEVEYKAKLRVMNAKEEKTLKECYNALGTYRFDYMIDDIKLRIAKIIWE